LETKAPRPRGLNFEEVAVGALEEVTDLAESIVRRRSLRLWDVQVGGRPGRQVVRVLVDADEGIDLDTVAEVSEELSRGLDVKDPIPGRYTLEVSSPGLERPLHTAEHFALSIGRDVVVKTTEPLVPQGNRLEGRLIQASDMDATIRTDGGEVQVPYELIKQARTVFQWK
jgi:ribosome maturation factor RimP